MIEALLFALNPPVVHEQVILASALFPPPRNSNWNLPNDTVATKVNGEVVVLSAGSVVRVLGFSSPDGLDMDLVIVEYNGDQFFISY